jgi:NAD(P)-dependent dehydrogenase (short-subunit alcohol dehydrogenase family)
MAPEIERPQPEPAPAPSRAPGATPVVLVTGCSSGIGQACCERLAAGGRRVYGASRTSCAPARWTYLPIDVADEASVQAAVAEIMRREGRIDAVVHCAGVSLAGAIEDTTVEEAKHEFDVNFFGVVRVVRAVLPVMRRQASGRILVIGSIGGLIGLPFIGYYSASKFALDGLVEALRLEVEPFGIEAAIVHPGDFHTAISANQILCRDAGNNPAYGEACRRTVEIYDANVRRAPPADMVARRVERLLGQRRRLPVRSIVGSPTEVLGVWLKSVLPSRSFEYIFRKSYEL